MLREYGQPQKRDNPTYNTLKALALTGTTAGGLYSVALRLRSRVQAKLIEGMRQSAENLIRSTGGMNHEAYAFARSIIEESPDISNLSVWRALKYLAVQNPVMDFWKSAAANVLPVRIADHLFGIARLREVYSAQSPVIKALGRLGDNPGLQTFTQRAELSEAKTALYKTKQDIAFRYDYIENFLKSNEGRWGIAIDLPGAPAETLSYRGAVQFSKHIYDRISEHLNAIGRINYKLKLRRDRVGDIPANVTTAFNLRVQASQDVLNRLRGLPMTADVQAKIAYREAQIAKLKSRYEKLRVLGHEPLSPESIASFKTQMEMHNKEIDSLYEIVDKISESTKDHKTYAGRLAKRLNDTIASKYNKSYMRWRTSVLDPDMSDILRGLNKFSSPEEMAAHRINLQNIVERARLNPMSAEGQKELKNMRRFEELVAQREYDIARGPSLFGDPTGQIFKVYGSNMPAHEQIANETTGINNMAVPLLDPKIEKMPGSYEFYGTTQSGYKRYRSAYEKMVEDLSGQTSDLNNIYMEAMQAKERRATIFSNAISLERGGGEHNVEELAYLDRKLTGKIARYQTELDNSAWAATRKFFDMGFHPRTPVGPFTPGQMADDFFFKQFRNKLSDNIDRLGNFTQGFVATTHAMLLNTDDFSHLRDETTLEFRGLHAFEAGSPKSWLGAVLGGHSKSVYETLGDLPITNTTLQLHNIFNRMNESISRIKPLSWLALSSKSAVTPAGFIGSVFLKRVLPLVAIGFYANYLNNAIGQHFGHRPTDLATEGRYRASLGWNRVKERMGLNKFFKHIDTLSGGFINHLAHPFMRRPVGMSPDEYREQEEHGYQEVRRGRWWWFGSSTPFRGGRIDYFGPTRLQYARAGNPYLTDTLWGGYNEYYANAAFPTPEHPFAPLRHFILDRYHYERKHYKDRPYPVSSPLFEPTSFWGTLLNPTLGRLIKPTIYMHENDMPYYVKGPKAGQPNPHYKGDKRSIEQQVADKTAEVAYTGFATPSGQINVFGVEAIPGAPYAIDQIQKRDLVNTNIRNEAIERAMGKVKGRDVGEYGQGASGITVYGSGSVKSRKAIGEINASIHRDGQYWPTARRGVQRFTGGSLLEKARVPGLYRIDDPNNKRNRNALISPTSPGYQAGLAYYNLSEFGGIYGFLSQSITGIPYSTKPTLANAGEMTSFERMYWDRMNLGGLAPTPGLSEIFRRFLPHKYHSNTQYNPIANTMPTYLPGSGGQEPGYFMDFLTGDPYSKISNGEVRLPGAAYEKLHGIPRADLSMRGSQLGYDEGHIYDYLTGHKEPFSSFLEEIMEKGSRIHSRIQARWRKEGILEGAEVPLMDRQYDISGTVDAILKTPFGGKQVTEIKTLSDPRWKSIVEQGHTDPSHLAQLNFYMHETGIHSGKLVYVRRSDMAEQDVPVAYSETLWQSTLAKIQRVRGRINQEIDEGQWAPGSLYSDVEKFKILADVAPWSQQYRLYRDYLTHLDEAGLTDQERATIRQTKEMVSAKTKRYEFSPYMMKYSKLTKKSVRVEDIIGPTTFMASDDGIHPVRLAGINPTPEGLEYLSKIMRPGRSIQIGIDADPNNQISEDTLKTRRAVVYLHGMNVNRYMLEHNLATENRDNSTAAIYVKYTPMERKIGGFLETIGHMPIPFIHNKFMPLDDALELYKRTQVYGKEWQDWKHPLRDFVAPFFETTAQQGLPGIVAGGIAAFMWIGGSPIGKKWAPAVAVGGILATKAWRSLPGHQIPGYRERENDINEYYDVLKYLKYKGLYEAQRRWIIRHEHHDIGTLIERLALEGRARKEFTFRLKSEKRGLLRAAHRDGVKDLNRAIREASGYREQFALTRADALAIQYYNLQKQTLYGADSFDIQNVLLAMPAKSREFFTQFLKAPTREHKEILKVTPQNWHRFLEAAWGAKPEERPNLNRYFKRHYLPAPDWAGWSIHNNLDDYRLVTFKNEALNMTSQGFWPQDEERVAQQGNRDVQPFRRTREWHFENAKRQLSDVASGLGLSDIDIQFLPNMYGSNRYKIDVQDDNDKTKQYAQDGYVPPKLSQTLGATVSNPSTMFTR